MPSGNVLTKIYHWASLTPTDPTPNSPSQPHVGCEATAVNGPALRGHKYPVSSSGGLFGPHDSNQSVCSPPSEQPSNLLDAHSTSAASFAPLQLAVVISREPDRIQSPWGFNQPSFGSLAQLALE